MTEAVPDQQLRLADGRRLGFRVWGDPDGDPLLFLHGTPGSRLEFAICHAAGRAHGLAMITPDRWGYGLSDVPAAPSLRMFAHDMAALMDRLGYHRFAVAGISGGGPYASATGACLGDRVSRLALISPVGPIVDSGLAGDMRIFHRFCFTRLPHAPAAVATIFRSFRWTLAHAPRLAARIATLRGGGVDRAIVAQPDIGPPLLASFLEGLRPGPAGPVTDLALFAQPWGIDLADITAPARLWLGTHDKTVPQDVARALAARIAGCRFEPLPGEGHLWVAVHFAHVLAWVRSPAVEHTA